MQDQEVQEVKQVADVMKGVVAQIVELPNEVEVKIGRSNGCVVLDVKVDDTDVGRLIGLKGRTAEALRTIVGNMGRGKTRYQLVTPAGGKR